MSHFLDRLSYFTQERESYSDGHGQVTREDRTWEESYRQRWQHDKIMLGICNKLMALSSAETARSRPGFIEQAPPRWMHSCAHPMKLIYHDVMYCQGRCEFGRSVKFLLQTVPDYGFLISEPLRR